MADEIKIPGINLPGSNQNGASGSPQGSPQGSPPGSPIGSSPGSSPGNPSKQPVQSAQSATPLSVAGVPAASGGAPATVPSVTPAAVQLGSAGTAPSVAGATSPPAAPKSKDEDKTKPPETFSIKTADAAPKTSILQSLLMRTSGKQAGAPRPATPSIASLLGPKPAFVKAAAEESERRRTKIAKSAMIFSLLAALGAYGYFSSQLNPNFTMLNDQLGPNIAVRFSASNEELEKVKTDLNEKNFRIAALWLDEANSQVDAFEQQYRIANSDFATPLEKQNAQASTELIAAEIKKSLGEVQKILKTPIGVDIYSQMPISPEERENHFESLLKKKLSDQKVDFMKDAALHREEIRFFDNVIRFVENKKFRSLLKSQDIAGLSHQGLAELLAKIREQGTDTLSQVAKIRKGRLDWGQVIQDVHQVTRKVDAFYGQGLFQTIGGFQYASYEFDSDANRVSVSGITKTSDSKTFSFIAQLVDAIEKSPKFKDIDFRSFAKTRDQKGDYASTLNLEFTIQTEPDSRDDIPESIGPPEAPETSEAPESPEITEES